MFKKVVILLICGFALGVLGIEDDPFTMIQFSKTQEDESFSENDGQQDGLPYVSENEGQQDGLLYVSENEDVSSNPMVNTLTTKYSLENSRSDNYTLLQSQALHNMLVNAPTSIYQFCGSHGHITPFTGVECDEDQIKGKLADLLLNECIQIIRSKHQTNMSVAIAVCTGLLQQQSSDEIPVFSTPLQIASERLYVVISVHNRCVKCRRCYPLYTIDQIYLKGVLVNITATSITATKSIII